MKITKLFGLCASALYVTGICFAVADSGIGQNKLYQSVNPLNLPAKASWDTAPSQLPESLAVTQGFEQVDATAAISTIKTVEASRLTGLYDAQSKVNQTVGKRLKFVAEEGISGENDYFIVLSAPAVPAYKGEIKGYPATNPAIYAAEIDETSGTKSISSNGGVKGNALKQLLATSDYKERVDSYKGYLLNKQSNFVQAARAHGVNITAKRQLTVALNAITVSMTQAQAENVSNLTEVRFIERVKTFQPQTVHVDNERLGLHDAPSGNDVIKATDLWAQGFKGEGIIVGVADTGINTDHPSFHDFGGEATYVDDSGIEWATDDIYDFVNPFGKGVYVGDCAKASLAYLCNDKLIGVRSYKIVHDVLKQPELLAMAVEKGAELLTYTETLGEGTGEDYTGHGSHTAGTSAGNQIKNVDYIFRGYKAGPGTVSSKEPLGDASGVAPRANVIAYQVCIPSTIWAGCLGDIMVQAVEDAIQDGVDVMNFSLGGGPFDPYQSAFALAMLNARESGMHSIAASGNAGYDNASYAAPWIMSVGATSLGRHEFIENSADVVDGAPILAMRDGLAYDEMEVKSYVGSISGTITDDEGEPVFAPIILAANYGSCIEGDCSLQPTCQLGDELVDGMCYTLCEEDEFRDPVSKACIALEGVDPDRDPTESGCRYGEVLVDGECIYDSETINAKKSICEGKEYGIYDDQFEEDNSTNHYACEGVSQAINECVPSHIGKTGASAGLCCSFGIYPDVAPGKIDNSGDIDDPLAGACCANGVCGYPSQGSAKPIEEAGDEFRISSVLTPLAASIDKILTIEQNEHVRVASTEVEGTSPILSRYQNDYYCENLDKWQVYNETTNEIDDFSFDGKIVMCARGNGNGLNIYEKAYNVTDACDFIPDADELEDGLKPSGCAAGMILYNDDKDFSYNNVYTLAFDIPFMHINFSTWETEFEPFMSEGENHQIKFPSTFRVIGSDKSLLDHITGFSSYGPHWYNPNIMSPSVVAPGEHIYAPWSDEAYFGIGSQSADWTFETGTSMAAPHVTGAMALMIQARSNWTASERDSAVLLTARKARWGISYISEAEYDPNNPNHYKNTNTNGFLFDMVTGKPIIDEDGGYVGQANTIYLERGEADYNHGGAGVVDIEAATRASLVLDESTENMRAADPQTGADVSQLNVPYLFNGQCPSECYFVRTFTATEDGTWSIQTSSDELSVEIESSVQSFSLNKGESKTIFFTVRLERSVAKETNGGGYVFGEVNITPMMPNSPKMKLAVAAALATPVIPTVSVGKANYKIGQFPVSVGSEIVDTDDLQTTLYRSSEMHYVESVSGTEVSEGRHGITELSHNGNGGTWFGQAKLTLNDTYQYSMIRGKDLDNTTSSKLLWVDIGEGTKVLAADALERVYSSHSEDGTPQGSIMNGMLHVLVGRDIDNDGKPEFSTEGMCWSGSEQSGNFCHIHDPEPGRYWVYFENINRVSNAQNAGQYDIHNYAIAVVPEQESTDMLLVAPTSVDGIYSNTWDVVYDIDLNQGESTFAFLEVGSRDGETNDVGSMVLRLDRKEDFVKVTPHRSNIAAGGFVKLEIEIAENHTGYDRSFGVAVNSDDEGLYQYVTGTLGGDGRYIERLQVDYNGFNFGGTQPNTYRLAKRYEMTTNLNPDNMPEDFDYDNHPLAGTYDQYCQTQINSTYYDGETSNYGYLDLARVPNWFGGVNFATQYGSAYDEQLGYLGEKIYLDTQRLFSFSGDADFNTLNAPASFTQLRVSPAGFIDAGLDVFSDSSAINMAAYFGPNLQSWPEIRIAPLQKGSIDHQLRTISKIPEDFTNLVKPDMYEGMSLTGFSGAYNRIILVEWDNAFTLHGNTFLNGSEGDRAEDSHDFQVWLDLEYNPWLGQKEIIFAYDNLNMLDGRGSVGIHGFGDYRGRFGPIGGYYNQSALFNNLNEGLMDDLLICFDYVGPEISRTRFETWVKLNEKSAGQTVDLTVDISIDGVTQQYIVPIEVGNNLTAPDVSVISLAQGTQKTVPLAYSDLANTTNEVLIESKDIKVLALGTQPGDDLLIDATCSDFVGETQAKIRIQDTKNVSDAVEQVLTIIVTEGVLSENCDTQNKDNDETPADAESDSGGSTGAFLLMLLLAMFTFRQMAKGGKLTRFH